MRIVADYPKPTKTVTATSIDPPSTAANSKGNEIINVTGIDSGTLLFRRQLSDILNFDRYPDRFRWILVSGYNSQELAAFKQSELVVDIYPRPYFSWLDAKENYHTTLARTRE